jgi:hypothetical protein
MESEACGETHFSTGPTATVLFLHREIWLPVIVIAKGPQRSSFPGLERRPVHRDAQAGSPPPATSLANAGRVSHRAGRLKPATGFFGRGDSAQVIGSARTVLDLPTEAARASRPSGHTATLTPGCRDSSGCGKARPSTASASRRVNRRVAGRPWPPGRSAQWDASRQCRPGDPGGHKMERLGTEGHLFTPQFTA